MAILKYFVERRFIKVVFSKVKNAIGGVSTGCKIALPKKWMDAMALNTDDRQVCMDFDPEKKEIVIKKADNCNKVVLSKEFLNKVGAKTNDELIIYVDKKDKKITLFKL